MVQIILLANTVTFGFRFCANKYKQLISNYCFCFHGNMLSTKNDTHPFAVLSDDELWLHLATYAEKFDDILVVELVEHVDLTPEVEQVMLVTRQQRLDNNERLQLPLPDPVSLCEKHVAIVTLTCKKQTAILGMRVTSQTFEGLCWGMTEGLPRASSSLSWLPATRPLVHLREISNKMHTPMHQRAV